MMANVYDLLEWLRELPGPRCNEQALALSAAMEDVRCAIPGRSVKLCTKSVQIWLGVMDLFTPSFEIWLRGRPVGLTDANFESLKKMVAADYAIRWIVDPQ